MFCCVFVSRIYCVACCTVVTCADLVFVWPAVPGGSHGGFHICLGLNDFLLTVWLLLFFWQFWWSSGYVLVDLEWSQLGFVYHEKFLTVSFFRTVAFARFSREAIICSPILVVVALIAWLLKTPLLVSFRMSYWKQRSSVSSTVPMFVGFLACDAIRAKLGRGFHIWGHACFLWWP